MVEAGASAARIQALAEQLKCQGANDKTWRWYGLQGQSDDCWGH